MNPIDAFAAGIAPDHLPALIAALTLPILVLVVRRIRPPVPGPATVTPVAVGPVRQWAAWLLGIAAAVHLALPWGHADSPVRLIALLGCGAAFAWLAMRAVEGRRWRLGSALLIVATLVGYLVVTGTGGEEPDQVGIATALVELAALGLCLVPVRRPDRPLRFKRFAGSVALMTGTLLVGGVVWVQFFLSHSAPAASAEPGTALGHGVDSGHSSEHSSGHDDAHAHAARAQAGVVLRPPGAAPATVEQRVAAAELAARTEAAMARFGSLAAARAAGYRASLVAEGTDVHLENAEYKKDGRVLDPERPEMLVYAISGGRATLLGVVYVMEEAGVPAPTPGGPITQWHAHNICLTLLPPGFGVVTPFGNCPALSVNVTSSEMMHVWLVDNPGGAYAEGLDEAWVREYHAEHGVLIGGTP